MTDRHLTRPAIALFTLAMIGGTPGMLAQTLVYPPVVEFRHGYGAELSYAFDSPIHQGDRELGDLNTLHNRLGYLGTVVSEGTQDLLVGVDWQRFSFGLPEGSPLPNTLQSAALKVGTNWRFAESWAMRLEADPGFYSDFRDISWDDFNAPFAFRVSYQSSPSLLWVVGLSVDLRSDLPVVGGLGVRWNFAEQWTLNLIMPRPRIEYAATENLTLFAGGELKSGAYRVADDFGRAVGMPDLDNQVVDYRELRVGAGARYRFCPHFSAVLEGGWLIDRRFEYDDADLLLNGDGAPYLLLSVGGRF